MRGERGEGRGQWRRRLALAIACLSPLSPLSLSPLSAQFVRPEDRALFTDFSVVTAIAATPTVVYVATPQALVVYDRLTLRWRDTVSPLDGYLVPPTILIADPATDAVWLGARGQWTRYNPFGRLLTPDAPPPGRHPAPLDEARVRREVPAFDVHVFTILRDAQLRNYRLTSAAMAPSDRAVFVGTDGNGAFRVDAGGGAAERLPAGLLTRASSAVVLAGGRVCAGSDGRDGGAMPPRVTRRGVVCLDGDGATIATYEDERGVATVGAVVRDVAVGPRGAVWAASETGVVRFGRGRAVRLGRADGLADEDARVLRVAGSGVWVGSRLGLSYVADAERPVVTLALTFGAAVGALHDAFDTLWIGSAGGLAALPAAATQPAAVAGPLALRDPIVGIASLHDTLVVATASRVLWRVDGAWSDVAAVPAGLRRLTALTTDGEYLWIAGAGGLACFVTRAGSWIGYTSATDVPPVDDLAADGRWVWAATPLGLFRYDRRALVR